MKAADRDRLIAKLEDLARELEAAPREADACAERACSDPQERSAYALGSLGQMCRNIAGDLHTAINRARPTRGKR